MPRLPPIGEPHQTGSERRGCTPVANRPAPQTVLRQLSGSASVRTTGDRLSLTLGAVATAAAPFFHGIYTPVFDSAVVCVRCVGSVDFSVPPDDEWGGVAPIGEGGLGGVCTVSTMKPLFRPGLSCRILFLSWS